MFRNIPDDEAQATVRAAWDAGTRFFDTAPFYGAGLSEIRLGKELAKHKRSEYVLSSKVGRLILDELEEEAQSFGEKGSLFEHGHRNSVVYDYSGKGTVRPLPWLLCPSIKDKKGLSFAATGMNAAEGGTIFC